MSEEVNGSKVQDVAALRKQMRSQIFSNSKRRSEKVNFMGVEIEIRQPSMRELFSLQSEEKDLSKRAALMIVGYSYIPDTDEKVFDEADVDPITEMPFGDDLQRVQNAINRLTGTGETQEGEVAKN